MDKLYFLYSIISNKTVRAHENFYKKFKKKNKYTLGTLIKTNRGYFIDNHQVDEKSVELWHKLNNNEELAKQLHDTYQDYLKSLSNE